MQKRAWTAEEDRLLKYVFETSKLNKWSHIARKLHEEYGVKGRNGKQCKERYATHIDQSFQRQEWTFEDEQKMVQLHNQLGNKWAVMGSKLSGRSDNCVKNHFYSLLRKALRKINRVIHLTLRKQYKQFSPTILYRIVEVTEERFRLFPTYDPTFCDASQQLKNDLIEFSYDDAIDQQQEPDVEVVRQYINRLNEFAGNYKRRAKKDRKGSGGGQDLLTPHRYSSQDKEEDQVNSLMLSSENSNLSDLSDDQISRNSERKSRRGSSSSFQDALELPYQPMRTRTKSQGNFNIRVGGFTENQDFEMQNEKNEEPIRFQFQDPIEFKFQQELKGDISSILGNQGIMAGIELIRQQQKTPSAQKPANYHFFEQSGIKMRIIPQIDMQSHTSQFLF